MAEAFTPDLCVIGAGPGGLAVATAAATVGARVVLVEKARLGGNRLHAGDVPSKALLAAARRAETMRLSGAFGVKAQRPVSEFYEVNDHIHGVIAALAPNEAKERLTALGIRLIEGEARFTSSSTLTVGDTEIKARRFVIATGSVPAIPAIPGLDRTPFLTTDTVFDARERPKHLVVLGAGPVALELAQAFRRLGSDVTVLCEGEPLDSEDPEAAAIVLGALAREGVAIRTSAGIVRVRRVRAKVEVVLAAGEGEETIEGTDLLIAGMRRPAIDNLGLAAAGVRHGEAGIAVDKKLRTRNRRVYAIGDAVAGAPRYTHVAQHHAAQVVRHAVFRQSMKLDHDMLPRAVFTEPELAQVGLSEARARQRYRSIRVRRWGYQDNDRAQAERATQGHIKVVTDAKGQILGVTIVGAFASELITTWTLAINHAMNISAVAEIAVPYPTFTEIGRRAALSAFTARLTTSRLRRILAWMNR